MAAVAALMALAAAVASPAAAQPDDTPHWAAAEIDDLAGRGVFDGTECDDAGGFCPDDSLDRKTMAVWVVRLLDRTDPAPGGGQRFSDVDASGFHAPFVERMADLGVTQGCDATRFCPDDSVTRAQMAVFLQRAYELPAGPDPGFGDVADGAWYASAVAALAASGITQGCSAGLFCPDDTVTRAQMAVFLHRAPAGPSVTVDPATVGWEGTHDFTISGAGFDPALTIYVLVCTIPGDAVSADTPAADLEAAMARVARSDCDLGTAQPVSVDADGSFVVQRSAAVGPNFMWVASDAAETQNAGSPVHVVVSSTITVGDRHFCVLYGDGAIGCLGHDVTGANDTPAGTFSDLAAGSDATCGVRVDGTVTCWGNNLFGMIDSPQGDFTDVAVGGFNACAVNTSVGVTCWGGGSIVDDAPRRRMFSRVSVGGYHACALGANGSVLCWGPDEDTTGTTPSGTFAAVDSGGWHACGLRTDGTVTCWGGNRWGQADAPSGAFQAVAAAWSHSCGLRLDGTIECWGDNRHGQTEPPKGTFLSIDAGGLWDFMNVLSGYSCGVRTNDGLIECWGNKDAD